MLVLPFHFLTPSFCRSNFYEVPSAQFKTAWRLLPFSTANDGILQGCALYLKFLPFISCTVCNFTTLILTTTFVFQSWHIDIHIHENFNFWKTNNFLIFQTLFKLIYFVIPLDLHTVVISLAIKLNPSSLK